MGASNTVPTSSAMPTKFVRKVDACKTTVQPSAVRGGTAAIMENACLIHVLELPAEKDSSVATETVRHHALT